MRISPTAISKIAEEIVLTLDRDGDLEIEGDKSAVIEKVRDIIIEDLRIEDELDKEVWSIIENNKEKFREIQTHVMFSHIKRQLIRDRKLII